MRGRARPADPTAITEVVQAVLTSSRYRHVAEELVGSLAARALNSRLGVRDAIKETKTRLHQIAGAFADRSTPYSDWLDALAAARRVPDPSALQAVCLRALEGHASTRERLPFLPEFYAAAFADIGPVRSVLDVACGLNPLAVPWMPLTADAAYYACDIFTDQIAFVNRWLFLYGLSGFAETCDVTVRAPDVAVDLALMLKALPTLEQIDRSAPLRLLRAVRAPHIVVSFPTRSLGGCRKGMAEHYESRFRALVEGGPWTIARYQIGNELCFRLSRSEPFSAHADRPRDQPF